MAAPTALMIITLGFLGAYLVVLAVLTIRAAVRFGRRTTR